MTVSVKEGYQEALNEQRKEVRELVIAGLEQIKEGKTKDFNTVCDRLKKLKFALDLYKNKKASLGYCASIADMPKEDFIQYLGENGISIFSFESEQEFLEELANA